MPPEPQRSAGFTLIEILVALAVLAIAVSAVVTEVAGHADNAAYLRQRTLAHWVAMNEVAALQVSGQWPGAGQLQGKTLMAGREWPWVVRVSKTEDQDMHRLDVKVYAGRRKEQTLASMVAYLARPADGTAQGPAPGSAPGITP